MSIAKCAGIALEALLALTIVLLLHGGAYRGAETLLEHLSPEPDSITLELAPDVALLPPRMSGMEERATRVAADSVNVTGYAPPGSVVRMFVNDAARSDFPVDHTGRFMATLPLRPGFNSIAAQMREAPRAGLTTFVRTANLLLVRVMVETPPLLLYSRVDNGAGALVAYGATTPGAFVSVCRGDENTGSFVDVDPLGSFRLDVNADENVDVVVGSEGSDFDPCVDTNATRLDIAHAPLAPVSRHLTLRVHDDAPAELRMKMRMPDVHPLVSWAQSRVVSAEEIAEHLFLASTPFFGFAPFSHEAPPSEPVIVTRYEQSGVMLEARVDVRTEQLRIGAASGIQSVPMMMSLSGDRIDVEARSQAPVHVSVPPAESVEKDGVFASVWRDPVPAGVQLVVATGYKEPDPFADKEQEQASEHIDQQVSQASLIPVLNRFTDALPRWMTLLGYALLSAIPFIWCLVALTRHSIGNDSMAGLRTLTVTLLVVHAGSLLAWLVTTSVNFWPFVGTLLSSDHPITLPMISQVLGSPFPPLALGAAFLAARARVVMDSPWQQRGTVGWRVTRIIVLVPLFAIAFIAIGALSSDGSGLLAAPIEVPQWRQSEFRLAGGFVVAGVALGWLATYWLLRTLFRRAVPFKLAIAISLLMIVVPSLPDAAQAGTNWLRTFAPHIGLSPFLFPWWGLTSEFTWTVVIAVAGALTLRMLTTRTLAAAEFDPLPIHNDWQKYGWHALFLLFALPVGMLMDKPVWVWDLGNLFVLIRQLLPVMLLVALLRTFVRTTTPGQFSIGPLAMSLGALLFGFYLSGGSTNLLFVPLPMLLGWHLFRRHLFADAAATPVVGPADQASALRSLVALKDAQQLRHVFRTHAEKKYGEGDITRDEFESGLRTAEERVDTARAALPTDEKQTRRLVFSQGPGVDPLDNAKRALVYGLPLILLYQLGTIDRILQGEAQSFPLLEVTVALAGALSYWAVLAFVFGYFYHAIRGAVGPQKGLALAIALLLPTVLVLILDSTPILGLTTGERFLRILLFVAYLAIAFDWACLRKAGYGPRHLVLVYGAVPALAYASSLAALGGLSLAPLLKTSGCWVLQAMGAPVCGGG